MRALSWPRRQTANGILWELPAEGLACIAVGGSEYYSAVVPRIPLDDLRIGA